MSKGIFMVGNLVHLLPELLTSVAELGTSAAGTSYNSTPAPPFKGGSNGQNSNKRLKKQNKDLTLGPSLESEEAINKT